MNEEVYREINDLKNQQNWKEMIKLCEETLKNKEDFFITARMMEALVSENGFDGLFQSIEIFNKYKHNIKEDSKFDLSIMFWIKNNLFFKILNNGKVNKLSFTEKSQKTEEFLKFIPEELEAMKVPIIKYLQMINKGIEMEKNKINKKSYEEKSIKENNYEENYNEEDQNEEKQNIEIINNEDSEIQSQIQELELKLKELKKKHMVNS
jgi:hypothetical protein